MGRHRSASSSRGKRQPADAGQGVDDRAVWTPRIPIVWISMLLTAFVFVGLMGSGIAVLHMRVNAEAPPDN